MTAYDAASPLLAPLMQRLRLAADTRAVTPLLELAGEPGFPTNALGKRGSAGRHVGEVARISADGRQFWLVNARTGAEQLIDADFWRLRAQGAS
jgi:DNA replication ATP-dependent helicase Dna2